MERLCSPEARIDDPLEMMDDLPVLELAWKLQGDAGDAQLLLIIGDIGMAAHSRLLRHITTVIDGMILHIHHDVLCTLAGENVLLRQVIEDVLRESQLQQLLTDCLDRFALGCRERLPVHSVAVEEAKSDHQSQEDHSRAGAFDGAVAEADRGRGDGISGLVQLLGEGKEIPQDADIDDHQAPGGEPAQPGRGKEDHQAEADQQTVTSVGRQVHLLLYPTNAVAQRQQEQEARDEHSVGAD